MFTEIANETASLCIEKVFLKQLKLLFGITFSGQQVVAMLHCASLFLFLHETLDPHLKLCE